MEVGIVKCKMCGRKMVSVDIHTVFCRECEKRIAEQVRQVLLMALQDQAMLMDEVSVK